MGFPKVTHPRLPTTVVADVNDRFTFDGVAYHVAPGTYGTVQAMLAAMLAATLRARASSP